MKAAAWPGPWSCALQLLCAGAALLPCSNAVAQLPGAEPGQVQVPEPGPVQTPEPSSGLSRWFNPSTAPFIPVPSVGVDPNSGTTLGILPVRVHADEQHDIDRIIAPDVLHNTYFGWGGHARVYAYPSQDEQWSVIAGIKQRVERGVDAEYQGGRLREHRWSIASSLIYDRDGSPRFYGIGNESTARAQTNYTDQQELAQVMVGYNLTHTWQLQYTGRARSVNVLPGTLADIPSIQDRFARSLGIGTNSEQLNRLAVVYDTRDDLTVPTRGMEWVGYGGLASRRGVFNDSLYSEAGIDGRAFWPLTPDMILAAHAALRYLPDTHRVPFWALSSIGGDLDVTGGEQTLRGFGEGRFYDRDSFSSTVELRNKVWSFDAVATQVDLEVAPFIDLGRVFARTDTWPLTQLHTVGGVGFRGIARPFVVGFVDVGYGSEGVAVFTGINYPF
jgi:hypothetical protein